MFKILVCKKLSQKLPVNGFKWVEDFSGFDEGLIRSYNEISKEGYFLEVDIEYTKKKDELNNDLLFLLEKREYSKRLVANLQDRNE